MGMVGVLAILLAAVGGSVLWSDKGETPSSLYCLSAGMFGVLAVTCGVAGVRAGRGNPIGIVAAAVGILLGLGVTGISLRPAWDAAHASSWKGTATGVVGQAAPAFSMVGPDGKPVTDASLKGSVYILDFWTTQEAMPRLDAFRLKYKDAGLKVFAIAPESDWQTAVSMARSRHLETPVLKDGDTDGAWKAFNASVNAETILVGRDGKILGVQLASQYDQSLDQLVQAALQP
jgi:peroxiredoxin